MFTVPRITRVRLGLVDAGRASVGPSFSLSFPDHVKRSPTKSTYHSCCGLPHPNYSDAHTMPYISATVPHTCNGNERTTDDA